MVKLRSSEEIQKIRTSAGIVAETLQLLKSRAKPGVTTAELDQAAESLLKESSVLLSSSVNQTV